MSISNNINQILSQITDNVKLVAVSKTKPVEDILEAYNGGYRIFGENKVQELSNKFEVLPKDIEWHMIGHLQSNKVKFIAPFVSLIHAVDNYKLLKTINKEALKNNRIINCLLQIHIAKEETKFGFSLDEVSQMLEKEEASSLTNVNIIGVMGMATFTDDNDVVGSEFQYLANCLKELKSKYFNNKPDFKELSMGMSGDYKIAVEKGSTIIRVGSSIFGGRSYQI
ncbi:MAG: YggS family pyridoxal phosphate-dependent enzyme [Bacteroidetes bacterium]|nr:YggS family pyridoxal phosphate-dependent enzyme [Bacteroidota bacterium]